MVALVLRLRPKVFLHECTALFPGRHYFSRLLRDYEVHHFEVDPRDHGCPARRRRVYDSWLLFSPPTKVGNNSYVICICIVQRVELRNHKVVKNMVRLHSPRIAVSERTWNSVAAPPTFFVSSQDTISMSQFFCALETPRQLLLSYGRWMDSKKSWVTICTFYFGNDIDRV